MQTHMRVLVEDALLFPQVGVVVESLFGYPLPAEMKGHDSKLDPAGETCYGVRMRGEMV